MGSRPCIPFFTDQDVPESVGKHLSSAGHGVTRLRDCMPDDSADPVVAITCAVNGLVLITHDKDFRQASKRLQVTQREYRKLHRIQLRCDEVNSAKRIEQALSLIESEWLLVEKSIEHQMVIEITDTSIRIVR
jgi:predicted nuclease of predicted toxin-antitoxin system